MKTKQIIVSIIIIFLLIILLSGNAKAANGDYYMPLRGVDFGQTQNGQEGINVAVPNNDGTLLVNRFFPLSTMTGPTISTHEAWWLEAANVYCLKRGKNFKDSYKVVAQVNITWNSSGKYIETYLNDVRNNVFRISRNSWDGSKYVSHLYNENWQELTDWTNRGYNFYEAQYISYALSTSTTGFKNTNGATHSTDVLQNVLWSNFNKNFLTPASYVGIYTGASIESNAGTASILNSDTAKEIEAFKQYKQSYKPPEVIKTNITTTDDGTYCYIGPLRVKYTESNYNGKMFGGPEDYSAQVFDTNGKAIDKSYWSLVDSSHNGLTNGIPRSEQDFYIKINKTAFTNGGYTSGVSKLKMVFRDMVATSNFYLVENPAYPEYQNWLLLEKAETFWDNTELEIPINQEVELEGNLKIIKQDQDTKTPLQGVGFKIYNRTTGKYVTGTNPVTYGNESQARIFVTDSSGIITIEGLAKGDYQAIEVSIGDNYGYIVDGTPNNITVVANKTVDLTIYNKYKMGNLKIVKIDGYSKQPLEGVGFKIKNVTTGEYITGTNPVTYGNESQAKIYYTDSNGQIQIDELWEGNYQAIEVEIGDNYGYVVDGTPFNLTVVSRNTQEVTIDNDYQMGALKVVKIDTDTKQPLEGIGFKIKNVDNGQFVTGIDPVTYGTEEEAEIFYTDKNGIIQIDRLWKGNYQAIEVTIGDNYGYVVDGTPTNLKIVANETQEVSINNDYQMGTLKVVKVDVDTNEPLEGVGFIIRDVATGQYITGIDPVTYGTKEEAEIFYTDENGIIQIDRLWKGDYEAIEVTIGDNYGYIVEDTPNAFTIVRRETLEKTITNKYRMGTLKIIKQDLTKHTPLEGIGFKIKNVDNGQYITGIDPVTYGTEEEAEIFYTDENGIIQIDRLWEGNYEAIEVTIGDNYGYIVDDTPHQFDIVSRQTHELTIYNKYWLGELNVVKVDEDNRIPLAGIGFKIRNVTNGQYITGIDPVTYGTEEEAQIFYTDENGNIKIERLWEDEYEAIEVTIGDNEAYVVDPTPHPFNIIAEDSIEVEITNKKVYVRLRGYVWEDIQSEKMSVRNDLYQDSENDDQDIRVEGITVKILDQNGNVVRNPETGEEQITTTDENGEYEFEKLVIDDLGTYTIQFTYDGLIYENVIPHLDKDNGSKAAEPNRQEFNNRFNAVERGNQENQAAIKDANNNTVASVDYTFEQYENGREAKISQTNNCEITADTRSADYILSYDRKEISTVIENVNLGIYKRRQADLALQNELDQVKVEIEGYGHIYKYGSGYNTQDPSEVENSWNLGVRFESPYKQTYSRPIYQADAEYETSDDSKELKVALTYAITVANQESLTSRVNRIVDYFDSRYTIAGVGTGVSQTDGSITGALNYNESTYNGRYKKVEIYANTLLKQSAEEGTGEKVTQQTIYIQFNLSRENVLNMLNEAKIYGNDANQLESADKNLKNIAEITSFTTYTDDSASNLYAAVDKDSIPGNVQNVEDETTFEDDTDRASTLALVIANAREISGTVFEDLTDEELARTQNIAQGDGIYDINAENAIGGVTVQLMEADDSGNITDNVARIFDEQVVNEDGTLGAWTDATAEAVTDTSGSYKFVGFVPGKYVLKYTWGDGSYKIVNGTQGENYESMVENYKSTTIDYDRGQSEASNNKFYRTVNETATRMSHAIDNIEERKAVDEKLKEYNYQYEEEKDPNVEMKMTSTTPVMEFNIEYDDNDLMTIDLDRIENRVAFTINNMDFGIVARPVQNINLVKSISEVQLRLQNGQTLVNVQIDENGNLVGETNYTTYMPPIKQNGITIENGYVRIELDQDLMQGSTVEIKYRLRAENASQADYVDDTYGYYKYGESYYEKAVGQDRKDTDVITVSPSKIIDYLDESSTYLPDNETNIQYRWQEVSIDQIKNEKTVSQNVIDAIETGEYTTSQTDTSGNQLIDTIDLTQIFATDYLANANLKPVYSKGNTLTTAETGDVYMVTSKVLSSSDDVSAQNQAEIVVGSKTGGSKFVSTPGNYVPNKEQQETDDATSPEVIVVPSTGENKEFTFPVLAIIIAFVVLGIGIILIKKFVIDKRK